MFYLGEFPLGASMLLFALSLLTLAMIVDLVVLSIRSLRKNRLEMKFENFEVIHSSSVTENTETTKHLEKNRKLPIVKETSIETLATIVT